MAEAKKQPAKAGDKGKKTSEASAPSIEMEIFFVLFFVALIIFVTLPLLERALGFNIPWLSYLQAWPSIVFLIYQLYINAFDTLTFFSVFLTFLFVLGILYAKFKLGIVNKLYEAQLEQKEKEQLHTEMLAPSIGTSNVSTPSSIIYTSKVEVPQQQTDPRWENIKKVMKSNNPSDWRAAIIEADILLYEMLDGIGYEGETVSDKLKQVDKTAFKTLDDAWRAHKIRNSIAHEGISYTISRSEAENTIELYRRVFHEFYFV